MDQSNKPNKYRITVKSQLDQKWAVWFEGMSIRHEEDTTILEGNIKDNSSLQGILEKIHNLNLTILSLENLTKS